MEGMMLAGRLIELGRPLAVMRVPIPDVGPGEALIRVLRCGLTRGDLHLLRGELGHGTGSTASLLPDLPMTVGHDAAGEVVEVGPGVTRVGPGDLVVVKPRLTCGFCKFCRSERENLCTESRTMGSITNAAAWSGHDHAFGRYKDGFWSEYARVPTTNLERLRPGDDIDQMGAATQVAVGYRGLKRAQLHPGETVIVTGATGRAGIGAVQAALVMGAARVIAVARDPGRLEIARALDPRRVFPVSTLGEPVPERIRELTGGEGAQVLVDLLPGGLEVTVDCIHSLERGGRVCLIGGHTGKLAVDYRLLLTRNIQITSTTGRHYADYPELFNLVRSGALPVPPYTLLFFTLEQIADAFAAVAERPGREITWPVLKNARGSA